MGTDAMEEVQECEKSWMGFHLRRIGYNDCKHLRGALLDIFAACIDEIYVI